MTTSRLSPCFVWLLIGYNLIPVAANIAYYGQQNLVKSREVRKSVQVRGEREIRKNKSIEQRPPTALTCLVVMVMAKLAKTPHKVFRLG